ncbi:MULTISPECIES: Bcr/CflA family multidrug efflux MFS transporter [Pseudomonas]|uniref:Bcr/CflA family multidrug efflux MFS transporter n=1 Tax=Pseudomonas TaxID=286 RepID=UPI00159D9A82|nr:Bcr/CflA family multidrug efflux MFS transporter [Pseudomonas putida]NVN64947.1 Bcr/CflA family multidrug efflux MFS transporter [Pseudomonas putida]NVN70029.1 Bcr/CflA family multidrug efflux MFS transporter [Pseudomonas putida]WHH50540.1 Bcr/CflA family multidrug efflux MFS transporter [Pseudomonas sp. Ap32]
MLSNPGRLIVLLAALVAFAPLSIDTYLPSLPTIAADLGASASSVQLTIGAFLAGLCIGMLFHGPCSDRFGRRPVLIWGMALYLGATVGCMFAENIEALVGWRFLQALGGAAASVLARTIVRDVFSIGQAARTLSLMHLVTMLATLVAPLVGGVLMQLHSWRSIFAALFAFAAVCLLASFRYITETHPAERRAGTLGIALAGYWQIARSSQALAYILCMGLSFGGMFAFITASPYVYIEYFEVSPQGYGWLFGLNIFGVIIVTLINARLVTRFGPQAMLGVGATIVSVASIGLGVMSSTEAPGLAGIVLLVVLFVSVTGLMGANCVASLLKLFPANAGAAAGLAVASQFALGAAFSALVGSLADGSPRPMCLVIAAAGAGSVFCYLWLRARSMTGEQSRTA